MEFYEQTWLGEGPSVSGSSFCFFYTTFSHFLSPPVLVISLLTLTKENLVLARIAKSFEVTHTSSLRAVSSLDEV